MSAVIFRHRDRIRRLSLLKDRDKILDTIS